MDVTADLMCMRLQAAKRPEKFHARKEVLELFAAGDLKVGVCYAHNAPLDTWLTVTEVSEYGWVACGQMGDVERVDLVTP